MQKNNTLKSAYIHIPFCKKICSYCDFCKNFYNEKIVDDYLDALNNEIVKNYKGDYLDTLYIGGGTPSCLSLKQLDKLFNITKRFNINKTYEFTFECNFDDITEDLLIKLKDNKVNRISIGLETFNKRFEPFLERNIDEKKMIEKVNLPKKYFDNINVDLMYALYDETPDELKEDLNKIVKLNVQHISTYALIIEENTKLYINNVKDEDEDLQADMYNLINKILKENNYIHYEISNYAKKGYESKHNLTYWNNDNYYAFGSGASGFIGNTRYDNTKSVFNYIKGKYIVNKEVLDKNVLMKDEIMLNLRKKDGISKKTFYDKYNINIDQIFDYKKLVNKGYLIEDENNIFIPEKYFFISNEIIYMILE